MNTVFDTPRTMAAAYCLAWNSHTPDAVADFYEPNGKVVVNNGEPIVGRNSIAVMASMFYGDFPNLNFRMLDLRSSGSKTIFTWEWSGTHAGTKHNCTLSGWDEWALSGNLKIAESYGWFDTGEFVRQISGKA